MNLSPRLFLLSALLSLLLGTKIQAADRPNILLVLSDDHSAPHLGSYGDPNANTPHLDKFAGEGIRFDRAYTTAPQCMPSRASILTGQAPIAMGMSRFSAPLYPDIPTAPDFLKEKGYYVGVGGRDFHLDGKTRGNPPHRQEIEERNGITKFSSRMDYVHVGNSKVRRPARETFGEFLDGAGDKPFFFWFNFFDPHRPWNPSEQPDPNSIVIPPDLPDLQSVREDLANYYGELTDMDKRFAELLAVLEERGLAENTIVIFMGDNGAAWLRGKGTLYERGCHVPLLVRWPGKIKAGSHYDEFISGEDITPTILDALGIAPTKEMTGRSFLPVLLGKKMETRDAIFAERGAHGHSVPYSTIAFDLSRSVTTKKHRLIYNGLWQLPYVPADVADYNAPVWADLYSRDIKGKLGEPFSRLFFSKERPMFELFDLEADPYEINNLADDPKMADIKQELKIKLEEWMILQRDILPLPTDI